MINEIVPLHLTYFRRVVWVANLTKPSSCL